MLQPNAVPLIAAVEYQVDYLSRLIEAVPPRMLASQPCGFPNHPLWTVGHLTYSMQAVGGELGLAPWLGDEWRTLFGQGSTPVPRSEPYPSREVLLAALRGGVRRVSARLEEGGEALMTAPLPDERYHHVFPTVGHAAVQVLVGHAAFHVGQVSVWMRLAGLGDAVPPFL